ncbi:hypothetical protein [Methylorubrum aminovorans]
MKAGSFAFLIKTLPHALWTMGKPVVLQVNGSGPTSVNDLFPANDRNKA